MESSVPSEFEDCLRKFGATDNIVKCFLDNGYSNIEELKLITDYDLKSLIPPLLIRKKFACALASWLLDNDQEVEENILWTAGVHPSQTLRKRAIECGNSSKSCGSSNMTESTDRARTESIGESDLSLFDHNLDNLDICIRAAEDVAHVENFNPNKENDNLTDDSNIIAREKNPIWLLLTKGSLEEKRIANLPEDSILSASEIKVVAQSVAKYLFSEAMPPKRQVPPSTCTFWSERYFEGLFPRTNAHRFYFIKREEYKTKTGNTVSKGRPTGTLYTQLSLLRKKLLEKDSTAKLRTSSTSVLSTQHQQETNSTPQKLTRASCRRTLAESCYSATDYSPPEPDDQELRHQISNLRTCVPSHVSAELLQEWAETHEFRMRELKETKGTLWDYFKQYKGLAVPNVGPALIKKDFQLLYEDLDPNKLQDFVISKQKDLKELATQALDTLTAQVHKEKVAQFLSLTESDSITHQSTGLLLLLPFLFPGAYQVNKNWKPTKSNVLDSFLFKVDTDADVQDGIDQMRNHLKDMQIKLKWTNVMHLQPFVLVVGTSWTEIDQAHIVLDQIIYSFPSVLEAVEVCFQLFHSFHAQYPLESHNVWEFIQQAVYNIYTKFDWNHRSTSELAEQLGLTLKRAYKNKAKRTN